MRTVIDFLMELLYFSGIMIALLVFFIFVAMVGYDIWERVFG
jgi:hypothetical protein